MTITETATGVRDIVVNHVQRAYSAWPILVNCAQDSGAMITYKDLAAQIGIHHRPIRYVLGVIQDYCMQEGLPPLTILAVNTETKVPGTGFIAWDTDDLERGRTEVSAFGWASVENPFSYAADGTTENALVTALVTRPADSRDVYARVKVRGMMQAIFRKALLLIYEGKCAICGLTFEDALEAAHLIPWSAASAQERLDPTNGVLLCATHHRLFDKGRITITGLGRVQFYDPGAGNGPYSASDKSATLGLHGKRAFLPSTYVHQPSERALAHHHQIHGWDR